MSRSGVATGAGPEKSLNQFGVLDSSSKNGRLFRIELIDVKFAHVEVCGPEPLFPKEHSGGSGHTFVDLDASFAKR